MDTSKRLKDLTREVINFAEVTHNADSTYSNDLRFACELFCEYLNHQLVEIDRQLSPVDRHTDIQQTSKTLNKLSHLINPAEMQQDSQLLQTRLLNFNSEVEHLRHTAA